MHREVLPESKRDKKIGSHEHFVFEGIEYPASRQDLVDFAVEAELDHDTLNVVLALPERQYRNRDDVWRSIAEAVRVRAGNRETGSPRDDIGKEAVRRPGGILHP